MREIKFRGYETELKAWIYFTIGERYSVNIDTKSIGQYTGLKDKNGKEIFEGDIVKRFDDDEKPEQVIWGDFNCREWNEKGLEIIGNIWENLELLAN
jgi:hypothetical protein